MKALRLHGAGNLQIHEEPKPIPQSGESLIRVRAVGLCGSDLHWFAEEGIGDAQLTKPLVLGHEFAGEVISGPLAGQRVAVDPMIVCGKCESCQQGHPNLCTNHRFAGHNQQDGALCEYVTWPDEYLFPLPASITYADGAILEPLGVAIHSVDLAHIKVGMTVGVFGCGPIGLLIAQVVRTAGASFVIATDKVPARIQKAKELGADQIFQADDNGQERDHILEATGGRGVDIAFEVAGENPAVETSINTVAVGGKVILVGIPGDNTTIFTASTARRKGLTIKLVRRMKHVYPRAIRMAEQGIVEISSLASHQVPLEDAVQAFTIANNREGLKIIINP